MNEKIYKKINVNNFFYKILTIINFYFRSMIYMLKKHHKEKWPG